MGIFDKLRSCKQTAYISINAHNCVACWHCYNACPKQVFGKVDVLGHRHIRIKKAADCIGCMKCVQVCQHSAIQEGKYDEST